MTVSGNSTAAEGHRRSFPTKPGPHTPLASHPVATEQWRLLIDEAGQGAWNMAVDEVLLGGAADGGPATVRFYGWSGPTLSLGYFQPYDHPRRQVASGHCDVVRRASGGGAILHHHDLTYSLALPVADRWSSTPDQLIGYVHEALVATLHSWGVIAYVYGGKKDAGSQPPFWCFFRPSHGDVLSGGGKIAGSAQRRARGAILGHGSVLLAQSRLAPELPGIQELAGICIDPWELAKRWSAALALRLSIQLVLDNGLTSRERQLARRQVEAKFGRATWTRRR